MESINEKVFKMVRDIHKYPDALYILTIILAIDFGLNFVLQKNLLTFDWSQLKIGFIVVFVAAYIFFILLANILLALLKYFLLQILGSPVAKILSWFKSNDYNDTYKNTKNIFTLRNEALAEKSDFKLKIFNEHQILHNKIANDKLDFLSINFKFMLILLLDFHFANTDSIMQVIVNYVPSYIYFFALFALLILGLLWLGELFDTDRSAYKINWPAE